MTETGTAQQHYRDLIAAVRLVGTIQTEVDREEDLGCLPSAAWKLFRNATNYLLKQAQAVLRGDDADVGRPLPAAEWSLIRRLGRARDRGIRCQEN